MVLWLVMLASAIIFAFLHRGATAMSDNKNIPISDAKPDIKDPNTLGYETATFAAGCFWGVEASFQKIQGVKSTVVGYTGGRFKEPTYKDVCSGRTGHAEAVQLSYDPNIVSYEKLLDIFWQIHDPTTPNRQGPDVGSQYRSAIFFHTPQQAVAAGLSKTRQQKKIKKRIVTQIKPAAVFYKAEEYHQRYLEKRNQISCPSSLK